MRKETKAVKKYSYLLGGSILVILILTTYFLLGNRTGIEYKVKQILENDLGVSVNISELYYNEEKQGCFVKFKTKTSSDEAAVRLDTQKVDYKSEFKYYSDMVKKNISKTQLHKYNQKILNSLYVDWGFTITVMNANGETEWNGWVRLK